jgi:hypothetical protein
MRLTTSNVLLGIQPNVSVGLSGDDPANVTDPDFSTSYTGSDNNQISFVFSATESINYVAVAGINIANPTASEGNQSYVRVTDGTNIITTNYITRENCVMITFPAQSFNNLRVVVYNTLGNILPSVRFIAAGNYLQIPNGGESAGYNRQWLNRSIETKSNINNLAAPTSVLTKKVALKGSLKIPNVTKDFSETSWQTFLDFSFSNYFFILEQDQEGDILSGSSAYLCFDPSNPKVTAHNSTRLMNNIALQFRVFTGL